MNAKASLRKFAGITLTTLAAVLQAQVPQQPVSVGRNQPVLVQAGTTLTGAPLAGGSETSNNSRSVSALDGSGLISLSSLQKMRVMVGGSIASGYDSNPLNLGNGKESGLYTHQPLRRNTASSSSIKLLFQYHPTLTRYTAYSGETMHVASAKILGSPSERFSWELGFNASHGNDSLRLLDASQTTSITGPPGSGQGSGSYLPNAGTVTSIDTAFDLHYGLSAKEGLNAEVTDSYNSFPACTMPAL